MGVGVGAVGFHASSGKARHWGRKLDYWVRSHPSMTLLRTRWSWASTELLHACQAVCLSPWLIFSVCTHHSRCLYCVPEASAVHASVMNGAPLYTDHVRRQLPLQQQLW